jgi:hypothetical protein
MEDFPQSRDVDNQELQAGGERASSEDLASKESQEKGITSNVRMDANRMCLWNC